MTKLSSFHGLLAVVLATVVDRSHGWANIPLKVASARATSIVLFSTSSEGVESFSLKDFQNHEDEGEKMAKSIIAWLDSEWMPQEVHHRLAGSAKQSYITCREAGEADLMAIMTTIADDLTENWSDYDADAFIGAWDVVNYCSDYLVQVSGGESCDCSQKIF